MNTTLKTATGGLGTTARFSRLVYLPAIALLAALSSSFAQTPTSPSEEQTQINTTATEPAEAEPTLSADGLASLVAPIALYPDPLLIQVLAASTYPLEIVQLKQWLDENKKLNGIALAEALAKQNWDPSVQALAAFPALVNKLANKIQWTTDLGNAFLAQESDLMDAVQALRATAQENGALKTNDKQKVETESTGDGKQAITIEPAQRDVVYVPTYNTQVVYRDSSSSGYSDYSGYSGSGSGYDYSYVGYALAAAYGSYWGYYNWRDRYAQVNYKNYYNSRYNWSSNNKINNWNNKVNNWSNKVNNFNAADKSLQAATQSIGRWQHDPTHRGSAPYANRDLANRFGQGNNRLTGGAGNRPSQATGGNVANQLARGNQPSQLARANPGNQLGRSNLSRPPGGGSARPNTRPPNFSAPNRVGDRVPSNWPTTARGGAFGPANGDFARAFSARGARSMGPPGGFRGGPRSAGGPPMGGGFRGGPPMGGGLPAGGPPMGGAPPPPPPPPPAP